MTEGQGLAAFVLLGAAIVAASIYCSGRKIAKSNEKLARVHNEIMQFLVTRDVNPAGKTGYTPEDLVIRRDEQMEAICNGASCDDWLDKSFFRSADAVALPKENAEGGAE